MMQVTLDTVRCALSGELPGSLAHAQMTATPPSARVGEMRGTPRQSAVLVALFEREGRLYFPLTVRSDQVRKHKGQISLPGGAAEPVDQTLWNTALREAQEELGLDVGDAEPLGKLSPLCIVSSGFCVHPYVALVHTDGSWAIDASEVAEVIETPLALILDEQAKQVTHRAFEGFMRRIPYYAYEGHVIWGATAMILSELEQALRVAL